MLGSHGAGLTRRFFDGEARMNQTGVVAARWVAISALVGLVVLLNQDPVAEKKAAKCVVLVSCMDDHCLAPARKYVKKVYRAERIDSPTLAGPNFLLAENKKREVVDYLKEEIALAIRHHRAQMIFICAHEGCLGSAGSKAEQMERSRRSKRLIEGMDLGVPIRLLWIAKDKTVEEFE